MRPRSEIEVLKDLKSAVPSVEELSQLDLLQLIGDLVKYTADVSESSISEREKVVRDQEKKASLWLVTDYTKELVETKVCATVITALETGCGDVFDDINGGGEAILEIAKKAEKTGYYEYTGDDGETLFTVKWHEVLP